MDMYNKMKDRGKTILEEVNRMSDLMETKTVEQEFSESSLSRIWSYTDEYDIAIITAHRSKNIFCVKYRENEVEGKKFTNKENKERNLDLLSVLISKGYGITKVKGSYIENFQTSRAIEVSEESFFVVNFNNDVDFFPTMIKLSKYFCQDSVILKSKGEDAILYGTNNSDYPGLDNKAHLGKYIGGVEGQFMTRVKNRPFVFKENYNVNSRHLISERANKILKSL